MKNENHPGSNVTEALAGLEKAGIWWRTIVLPGLVLSSLTGLIDAKSLIWLLAIAVLPSLVSEFRGHERYSALDIGMLLVAGSAALSCVHTLNKANSLAGFSMIGAATTLYFALRIYSRPSVAALYAVIDAYGFILSIRQIVQWYQVSRQLRWLGFQSLVPFKRFLNASDGGFSGNDYFAFFVFGGISVLTIASFRRGTLMWFLGIFSLCSSALYLVLTLSRLVYISGACAVGVFVLLAIAKKVRPSMAEIRSAIAIVVCIGSLAITLGTARDIVKTANLVRATSQRRSDIGRILIASRALEQFEKSPLWGVGIGNYSYQSCIGGGLEDGRCTTQAFNWFIQTLVEQGIVGGVAAAFLWASAIFTTWKSSGLSSAIWAATATSICFALLTINLGQSALFARADLATIAAVWFSIVRTGPPCLS